MDENERTVIDQIKSVCIETSTWYWYDPKKTFTCSVLIRLGSSSASRSNVYIFQKKHYSVTKNNRERRQTYFQIVYHLSGIASQERYDESFFNWYRTHTIIQYILIYIYIYIYIWVSTFLHTWRWELSISLSDIVSLVFESFSSWTEFWWCRASVFWSSISWNILFDDYASFFVYHLFDSLSESSLWSFRLVARNSVITNYVFFFFKNKKISCSKSVNIIKFSLDKKKTISNIIIDILSLIYYRHESSIIFWCIY